MSSTGTEHPFSRRRLDGLVRDIEEALVGGDRAVQSELVRRSTDLLVKRWSCLQPDSKPAFDLLLAELLGSCDVAARTGFAQALARLRLGPPRTSSRLARDEEISVATPLLSDCLGLDEATLAEIAAGCGDAHRAAIAKRAKLSDALAETLLAHGDRTVATLLSGNPGTALSAASFARLMQHAATSETVALHLAMRPDLSSTDHAALIGLARDRALATLTADEIPAPRITALLDRAGAPLPEPSAHRIACFAASGAFMQARSASVAPSSGVILRWLGLNRIEDILAALAHRANLPVAFVVSAYDAPDSTILALILCGSGHPWVLLKALLSFRYGSEGAHGPIERAFALVRQVSPLAARRLLRLAALRLPAAAFAPDPSGSWPELVYGRTRDKHPHAADRLSA